MKATPKCTPLILAKAVLAVATLLAPPPAEALTKMREGFASMVVTDGTSLMPRNRISSAQSGDDVVYWIQWKEPVPKSSLRCVIKGPDTDLDDTENFAEADPEGYSICAMRTEDSDSGTFVFTQYLDGEKVGELSILVEQPPFFTSTRKKWKWMLGGLAFVMLAAYWVRRKATGDTRSLKAVMSGESRAEHISPAAIVIGSRVGRDAVVAAAAPGSQKSDETADLNQLARQFEWLLGQPDKPKALETGRKVLGLLLDAKKYDEALKVFKQCLAADPAFRLAQPEGVLPLAKAARAAGDSATSVATVRGFDKAFPGHVLIPDVFIFTAKLLAEDMGNKEMARKILEHILQRYPGHYLAQEARRYLESISHSRHIG